MRLPEWLHDLLDDWRFMRGEGRRASELMKQYGPLDDLRPSKASREMFLDKVVDDASELASSMYLQDSEVHPNAARQLATDHYAKLLRETMDYETVQLFRKRMADLPVLYLLNKKALQKLDRESKQALALARARQKQKRLARSA